MTLIPSISAICSFFATGCQSLFHAIVNEHELRECVIAEPPRRTRYRLLGSEYTAAILPCYQY